MRSRLDPPRGPAAEACGPRQPSGGRTQGKGEQVEPPLWFGVSGWVPPKSSQRSANWLSQAHAEISPF